MKDRIRRHDAILSVVEDMRADSLDGHGVDPHNFEISEVKEIVEDCTGFELNEVEWRLAVVAFNEGTQTAKGSIWYG